ncbi:threonine/serine dehydratase [Rhodobacteraceae bacterium RKSG542]|nr:threonine/serine dehydratase [Pseudovibrio flavus]
MPVQKSDILAAFERIRPFIRKTPVLELPKGAFGLSNPLSIKLEHTQASGSFKARGAFNSALSQDAIPEAGITAASGGNHGAAVACAAAELGIKAQIFVPEISNPTKIAKIKSYGADVHVSGANYADAALLCQKHIETTGALNIHPFDTAQTIAGQGTVAAEWLEQTEGFDTVLIAVGGGGLLSGIATYLEGGPKVIAVEPIGSCSFHAAMEAGEPVQVELNSVAANSLGASKCGALTYETAKNLIAQSLLVEDAAILKAQAMLWQALQLAVEPAAATGLAALISGVYQPEKGERVGILLCGGNVELQQVEEACRTL